MDRLKRDVTNLRSLVEKSRPSTPRHHDLEAVEKEVADLHSRWDKIKQEIANRWVDDGDDDDDREL
jgi:hypothetical protein